VTGVLVFIMVGLSAFLAPVLKVILLPVFGCSLISQFIGCLAVLYRSFQYSR